MEQKLNFNHNALTLEQLLQSRSNCSIVRAIGQFVHTAHCMQLCKTNVQVVVLVLTRLSYSLLTWLYLLIYYIGPGDY